MSQTIKFGVGKCLWNLQHYIIICSISWNQRQKCIYNNNKFSNNRKSVVLSTYEQICDFLNLNREIYLSQAQKFGAVVNFNPFIKKISCTFLNKTDAKKFIKEWLEGIKLIFMLSDVKSDLDHIEYYIS